MKTFDESWHRVAGQRLALRPSVEVRRQMFRGERWYVLHDPFANQFYRLRPAAYEFIARLRPNCTVQETWEETLRAIPDDAPGQEEVVRLLAQLYQSNLLRSDVPGDTGKLFERYKKRRDREIKSKFASIMFFRVPLFDPDDFLQRSILVARALISPVGALLWILVMAYGLKVAVENFEALGVSSDGILAPSNLPLLYLAMVLIKGIHEFGHAYACRRFGGEVHTMGIMFLIFTPVPYMDATASWNFRSRWKRILVAAAGMIVELFVAAIAVVVWANTGEGVVHSLAFNVVFIASVTTILFNANPLLRFDGYYILCDLLDMPNLHGRSARLARHVAERYLFGCRKSINPVHSKSEAAILSTFFVASNIYKVVLFTGIILFVADRFLILGIIMLVLCAVSWLIRPLVKFINYLASSPALARNRARAVVVTAGGLAVILGFLWYVPFPHHFRAPGVVQSQDHREVFSEGAGYLREVLQGSGSQVEKGQPIVRFEDPELDWQIVAAEAQLAQAEGELREARSSSATSMEAYLRQVDAFRQALEHLQTRKEALVLRAPTAGRWVAPGIDEQVGRWIERGVPLGHVVQDEFRFSAVVPQQQAADLFMNGTREIGVKVAGQAEYSLPVTGQAVLPVQRETLPSAALGWLSGGEVATASQDQSGMKAAEPFFEVRANLPDSEDVLLVHGRSGQIRFALEPQPLLRQWLRKLRQLVQERYQI